MAPNSHQQLAQLQRREKAAELYIQGHTQAAIAKQLGCTQTCVSKDLQKIREKWQQSSVRNFDLARAEQLLKLDRVEMEAWLAWERSKQPSSTATISESENKKQSRRTVKQKEGDPRWLQIVQNCITQRRAILGLDLLPQVKDGGTDGPATLELRRARVMAFFDGLGIRPPNGTGAPGLAAPDAGPVCDGGERGEMEDGPALEAPRPGDHGES